MSPHFHTPENIDHMVKNRERNSSQKTVFIGQAISTTHTVHKTDANGMACGLVYNIEVTEFIYFIWEIPILQMNCWMVKRGMSAMCFVL